MDPRPRCPVGADFIGGAEHPAVPAAVKDVGAVTWRRAGHAARRMGPHHLSAFTIRPLPNTTTGSMSPLGYRSDDFGLGLVVNCGLKAQQRLIKNNTTLVFFLNDNNTTWIGERRGQEVGENKGVGRRFTTKTSNKNLKIKPWAACTHS